MPLRTISLTSTNQVSSPVTWAFSTLIPNSVHVARAMFMALAPTGQEISPPSLFKVGWSSQSSKTKTLKTKLYAPPSVCMKISLTPSSSISKNPRGLASNTKDEPGTKEIWRQLPSSAAISIHHLLMDGSAKVVTISFPAMPSISPESETPSIQSGSLNPHSPRQPALVAWLAAESSSWQMSTTSRFGFSRVKTLKAAKCSVPRVQPRYPSKSSVIFPWFTTCAPTALPSRSSGPEYHSDGSLISDVDLAIVLTCKNLFPSIITGASLTQADPSHCSGMIGGLASHRMSYDKSPDPSKSRTNRSK